MKPRLIKPVIVALVGMFASTIAIQVCWAQGRVQRPRLRNNPAAQIRNDATLNRPTTSPYLNLLRPTATGVPNYQSLVRPQVQQDRLNRQQSAAMRNMAGEIREIEGAPPPYVGVRPTGHRATFGETGRYFGSYP